MSDTTVLYHADCLDGFAAAWSVWTKNPGWEYRAVRHGEPPPVDLKTNVVIVDFAYDHDTMVTMAESHRVTVLDHHKTAEAALSSLLETRVISGQFDMTRSGAMIAWDLFVGSKFGPPPGLVAIQDHDLWQFKHENTREFVASMYSYPFDDFVSFGKRLYAFELRVQEGRTIARMLQNQVRQTIDNTCRTMWIAGRLVPVCNAPHFLASDIGNQISKSHPFAATYYDTAVARVFSLRSSAENPSALDVSEIAEQYGGGGHKHAAGFSMSLTHNLGIE